MRILLALAFGASLVAQPLRYNSLSETALEQRLRLASPGNAERFRRLRMLFDQAGCSGVREQSVKGSKEPNLICQAPGSGESPQKIIVGGHFDSVAGDGVIDNWSGAVMLPVLYELLVRNPHRHTFEFVAFAAEEKGLLGSRAYVESLPKEGRNAIGAVIVLDSLGLTATKCDMDSSSRELASAAYGVAKALDVDFRIVNVGRVGVTDSRPFKEAKNPVLTLHSLTNETWRVINGTKDVWSAVSLKDYSDTHRLVSALLEFLDRTL